MNTFPSSIAFTPQHIAISDADVIGSIVANATNQANAVVQVFVADDDDGNLANGVPHYAELSAAAIAKGMPYPQLQLISIAHAPLANTTQQLTPRRVDCTAAIVTSGAVTDVRLVYNPGTGAVTRNMKPNGLANGYSGMLPGLNSGAMITTSKPSTTASPRCACPRPVSTRTR